MHGCAAKLSRNRKYNVILSTVFSKRAFDIAWWGRASLVCKAELNMTNCWWADRWMGLLHLNKFCGGSKEARRRLRNLETGCHQIDNHWKDKPTDCMLIDVKIDSKWMYVIAVLWIGEIGQYARCMYARILRIRKGVGCIKEDLSVEWWATWKNCPEPVYGHLKQNVDKLPCPPASFRMWDVALCWRSLSDPTTKIPRLQFHSIHSPVRSLSYLEQSHIQRNQC